MNQKHFLIGGTPKAATTSLFNYLTDHPQVCPANRKETYFFAREFDWKKVCRIPQTAAFFETYFTHCTPAHRLKMEATPYTLYAANSAATIKAMLPEATILFILRDPVARFISNFNMQKQRQAPYVKDKTLGMHIEDEFATLGKNSRPNNLELGCYSNYLPSYLNSFGKKQIKFLFFRDLTQKPAATMQQLCQELQIDAHFFNNYSFNNYNKSVQARSGMLNKAVLGLEPLVAGVRSRVIRSPKLYKAFEHSIRVGKFALRRLNDKSATTPRPPLNPQLKEQLHAFYQPYNEALADLLQQPLPWQTAVSPPQPRQ